MVSESQKESIRKEARNILDKFAKTLAKVPAPKERLVEGDVGRVEHEGLKCDSDFHARVFANAPHKTADCLVAEKGAWN